MKYILIVFGFLTINTSIAQTNDSTASIGKTNNSISSDAFSKDIFRLLELTGSAKIGIQVMSQMIASYKQAMPNVPDDFWTELMSEIDEKSLIDLIIPIYKKHYTPEDIKGIIAFYETPIGKKTISVLPKITEDSMLAGREWGLQIGAKVQDKLTKKGYNK